MCVDGGIFACQSCDVGDDGGSVECKCPNGWDAVNVFNLGAEYEGLCSKKQALESSIWIFVLSLQLIYTSMFVVRICTTTPIAHGRARLVKKLIPAMCGLTAIQVATMAKVIGGQDVQYGSHFVTLFFNLFLVFGTVACYVFMSKLCGYLKRKKATLEGKKRENDRKLFYLLVSIALLCNIPFFVFYCSPTLFWARLGQSAHILWDLTFVASYHLFIRPVFVDLNECLQLNFPGQEKNIMQKQLKSARTRVRKLIGAVSFAIPLLFGLDLMGLILPPLIIYTSGLRLAVMFLALIRVVIVTSRKRSPFQTWNSSVSKIKSTERSSMAKIKLISSPPMSK